MLAKNAKFIWFFFPAAKQMTLQRKQKNAMEIKVKEAHQWKRLKKIHQCQIRKMPPM